MKKSSLFILGAAGLLVAACQNSTNDNDVISQRYIHKYGYVVSKEEWESKNYPGQVITNLRNGVTVTATYENGVLHGPCTHTYPNSQTIESYFLYNQGMVVKEVYYDLKAMPTREIVRLSPARYTVTLWYADGTPMSIEEYANEELLEGQYLTLNNETEARVEKGKGIRIRRNQEGLLLSKEAIEKGTMVKSETFHPNGTPETVSYYRDGKLHGERKKFTPKGEPLAAEEFIQGLLHGKSTYYNNGIRTLEISYLNGKKFGTEVHYLDGERISTEVYWDNDKRHGPTTYYVDGGTTVEYYYDGKLVTQADYDELNRRDQIISGISPNVRWDGSR